MPDETITQVAGYELDLGRHYDHDGNLWVQLGEHGAAARVGFDPLGCEQSGDIVALSFAAEGTAVARGEPFGDIEAAKFVGPLVAPLSGTVRARNQRVLADPAMIAAAPLATWLIELTPSDPAELDELVSGAAVAPWFAAAVERFRAMGVIAE